MRCTQWPTSAFGSGMYCGLQSAVDRPPGLAAVVGAERARRRDGDEDPLGIARIEQDRVQAHPAGARLPARPRAVAAQSGQLLPGLAAVGRAEQGGVFHPGVDRVRIGQRRLEMPDALELPGVRRAVVPLVRAGDAVVDELVAHRLPRLAAVVGALDHLPEPAAGLRRVQPVRIDGRSLEVVDLPARKVRAADVPPFALAVRLRTNAPLRVPTSTRTPLIVDSFLEFSKSAHHRIGKMWSGVQCYFWPPGCSPCFAIRVNTHPGDRGLPPRSGDSAPPSRQRP